MEELLAREPCCETCGKNLPQTEKRKFCKVCRDVLYCSKPCKQQHAAEHKKTCKPCQPAPAKKLSLREKAYPHKVVHFRTIRVALLQYYYNSRNDEYKKTHTFEQFIYDHMTGGVYPMLPPEYDKWILEDDTLL